MGMKVPFGVVIYGHWQLGSYLMILCILAAKFQLSESVCDLGGCWELFELTQEKLGIRDDYPFDQSYIPPNGELEARCIVRRTFYLCLKNMTGSCRSELRFHGAYKGIEKRLKQSNCSFHGPVFNPNDVPQGPGQGQHQTVCTYTEQENSSSQVFCGLFGDPHLRTFLGSYETCRIEGAWPLLDNKHLTIQVTNSPVGFLSKRATAITELTVLIKANKECATDHFVTYQAMEGDLPATFNQGQTELGPDAAVHIKEVDPGHHVLIYLRFINTKVVIRQLGGYYSVAVVMPQELVTNTSTTTTGQWSSEIIETGDEEVYQTVPVQLCNVGCPSEDRIPYRDILAQVAIGDESSTSVPQLIPYSQAVDMCLNLAVTDFFLDSCVFDLMSTGDANFSRASAHAYQDSLKLLPQLAATYANRTDPDLGNPYQNHKASTSSAPVHKPSFYSILYQSHLNYLHRTTFILIALMIHGVVVNILYL